QLE
ncbi:hypothetical protein VCHENC02_5812, partial [Vibrio harveyi]